MTGPIRVPGLRTLGPPFSPALTTLVVETIQRMVATKPDVERPDLRIGPDLTFAVTLADGTERVLQLVADGAYCRDPATGALWRFAPGRQMLEAISPAQGFTEDRGPAGPV
jgi:hypothetical protein